MGLEFTGYDFNGCEQVPVLKQIIRAFHVAKRRVIRLSNRMQVLILLTRQRLP